MFGSNTLTISPMINSNLQELLKKVNINIDINDNLSDTQKIAFELFKNGKNLLILGAAGCGKSFLIKTMQEYIKIENNKKKMYLSSTTGISAYNIGGITIHSFMGIGTGEMEIVVLIKRVYRKKMYRERIINTDILVIDEISMLSAELFEKLNKICQHIRKNNAFFGGIQIILTGDLNQLLPVFNRNIKFTKGEEQDSRLIIESPDFIKEFNKTHENIINLKENFRQKNDTTFINLLLRIREGKHTDEDINILKSRLNVKPKSVNPPLYLVSSNKSAQHINCTNLEKIKEPVNKYITEYKKSNKDKDTEIDDLLVKELQFQFTQKGIDTLELKKGARVMLTKNMDINNGLVNGSIGTIDSFIHVENGQEFPVVIFDNIPEKQLISPVSIELELDNRKASATQLPLMLAYACTIHKSQSLSLDSAVLDLGDCFTDAQIYVALSRVKSLDGLYLKSFNPAKIKVNQKMTKYLNNL